MKVYNKLQQTTYLQPTNNIEATFNHILKQEWGNLVAVLTKVFGTYNLQLAEDVVQDTFIKAIEHWIKDGLPQNPAAWLYTVARNKATDVIRKQKKRATILYRTCRPSAIRILPHCYYS